MKDLIIGAFVGALMTVLYTKGDYDKGYMHGQVDAYKGNQYYQPQTINDTTILWIDTRHHKILPNGYTN